MKLKANVLAMWLRACKGHGPSSVTSNDETTEYCYRAVCHSDQSLRKWTFSVAATFNSRLDIWGDWATLKEIQRIKVARGPGAEDVYHCSLSL